MGTQTEANWHRLTNIASMSSIPATFLEHEFDFWTAYLMAFSSLVVSLLALVMMKSKFGQSFYKRYYHHCSADIQRRISQSRPTAKHTAQGC
jgi:hypothetical protein